MAPKIAAVLLALVLGAGLAACGEDDDDGDTTITDEDTTFTDTTTDETTTDETTTETTTETAGRLSFTTEAGAKVTLSWSRAGA
jgi:ABC-type glycerol-3-phosphate transport system substrate-binding protein